MALYSPNGFLGPQYVVEYGSNLVIISPDMSFGLGIEGLISPAWLCSMQLVFMVNSAFFLLSQILLPLSKLLVPLLSIFIVSCLTHHASPKHRHSKAPNSSLAISYSYS